LCIQDCKEEGGQAREEQARLSDVLPGGATIIWGSAARPAWFLQLRTAEECAATASKACENVLSSKQQKLCHKAVLKALKKRQGSCQFKELRRHVLTAIDLSENVEVTRAACKRSIKRFLKESDAWTIRKGVVKLI
jgi:hypothetical protein